MKLTYDYLKSNGFPSVTDYCRFLMNAGFAENGLIDPEEKIEVYRGEMLCFTVSSVEFGAKYEPDSKGGFKKYRRTSLQPR